LKWGFGVLGFWGFGVLGFWFNAGFRSKIFNRIDLNFDGFVRKLMTYMMEDSRMISPSLDLLFIAKAIERIGDHARNIAEFVIYVVKGEDVRHVARENVESLLK
jgi:phosphate uptake regulator